MTEEQFTPLAQRYMDTVFRVAYSYLRCRDDADDVTQDVLIQLYKEDKAFESDAHVKNWLIRVTVNRCKNVLRAPWHRAEDIADCWCRPRCTAWPTWRCCGVSIRW